MRLAHRDWSAEPEAWARALDVSREAIELYASSDVIDLHLDSFIWTRIFGYDLRRKHGLGLFGRHFYSQVDFPRALEAGLTGGTWIITTNPFKPARWRRDAFFRNLDRIKALFADFYHVRQCKIHKMLQLQGMRFEGRLHSGIDDTRSRPRDRTSVPANGRQRRCT